jgi:cytochrome c peroxidase
MDKVTAAAAIAGMLAGISTAALAATTISQKDKTFSEESVTVKAGDKIRFVNEDTVTHNITVKGPDGVAKPGVQEKPGDSIELSFDDAGVSEVRCLIHPKMKLSVDVK